MGRAIVTAVAPDANVRTRGGPGSDPQPAQAADTYNDMLLKLIPAEVIGVYLAMQAILDGAANPSEHTALVVFVFGVFATFFYLRVVLKVKNLVQLTISAGAFCVWAYSMSEGHLSWYDGTYAGLLLIGYTFIAPKIPLGGQGKKA